MIKLYWYELVYRGLSVGTQPSKPAVSEPSHVNAEGKDYGAVAYIEPLTDKQIDDYELREIDPPRALYDYEIINIKKYI